MTDAVNVIPAAGALPHRSLRPWTGALIVAAAAIVPFVRQAGRPWDSLWAEDGAVYVSDANAMPLHATLFRGYGGYGQLLSRLLAMPTRYLPVSWIAPYMALAATVTASVLAVFVYRAARSHIPALWARLSLAGACVLLPVLAFENEATVVNLPWILTFAAFWAIVSHEDGGYDVAARSVVAFLAITATPIAAAFLPLLVAVLVVRRRRADAIVGAAYVTGILIQAATMLSTENSTPTLPSSLGDLVVLYPVRVVASAFLGEQLLSDLWSQGGVWLGIAAVLLVSGILAAAIWRFGARPCGTVVAAVALSLPLFAVPVFLRGTLGMRLVEGAYNPNGARYTVVPVLLVLSAVAVLCARARRPWVAMALAFQLALVCVLSLGNAEHWRPQGPSWTEGVRQARETCQTGADPAGRIPIAPVGWAASLPCSRMGE